MVIDIAHVAIFLLSFPANWSRWAYRKVKIRHTFRLLFFLLAAAFHRYIKKCWCKLHFILIRLIFRRYFRAQPSHGRWRCSWDELWWRNHCSGSHWWCKQRSNNAGLPGGAKRQSEPTNAVFYSLTVGQRGFPGRSCKISEHTGRTWVINSYFLQFSTRCMQLFIIPRATLKGAIRNPISVSIRLSR